MDAKYTPSLSYWFGKIEDGAREMIEIHGPEGRTLTVTAEQCYRNAMVLAGIPDPAEAIKAAREALEKSLAIPHLETEMNHALCVLQERSRRTVDEVVVARKIRADNRKRIDEIRDEARRALKSLGGRA